AVPGVHEVVEGRALAHVAIPHPVQAVLGDRVHEDVAGRHDVVGDHVGHAGEGRRRHVARLHGPPPADVAGVTGDHLGQEDVPGAGRHSVWSHVQVAYELFTDVQVNVQTI